MQLSFHCVSSSLSCQYVDCITRLKESLEDMMVRQTSVCLSFCYDYPLTPICGIYTIITESNLAIGPLKLSLYRAIHVHCAQIVIETSLTYVYALQTQTANWGSHPYMHLFLTRERFFCHWLYRKWKYYFTRLATIIITYTQYYF